VYTFAATRPSYQIRGDRGKMDTRGKIDIGRFDKTAACVKFLLTALNTHWACVPDY